MIYFFTGCPLRKGWSEPMGDFECKIVWEKKRAGFVGASVDTCGSHTVDAIVGECLSQFPAFPIHDIPSHVPTSLPSTVLERL